MPKIVRVFPLIALSLATTGLITAASAWESRGWGSGSSNSGARQTCGGSYGTTTNCPSSTSGTSTNSSWSRGSGSTGSSWGRGSTTTGSSAGTGTTTTGTSSTTAANGGASSATTPNSGTTSTTASNSGTSSAAASGGGTSSTTASGGGATSTTASGGGTSSTTASGGGATSTTASGGGTTSTTASGGGGSVSLFPADRNASANWQKAGLLTVGDIPNRTTVCATVSPLGGGADDTANIQNAIEACPLGQVVKLAAGTFTIAEGSYVLLDRGVTLRGAGAGVTILQRTTGAHLEPGQAYGSNPSPIIIIGPARYGLNWNTDGNVGTSINLAADAAAGSTSITLNCGGNCASTFSVGQVVLLDENSGANWVTEPTGVAKQVWAASDYRVVWKKRSPSLGTDDFTATQYPYQTGTAGDGYSRLDRVTNELKQIASISGNTITFNSPLTISYRVSHAAQVTWLTNTGSSATVPFVTYAGLEAASVSNGDDNNIDFESCAYCWLKNVESSIWNGRGIEFDACFRCEAREVYSHDAAYSQPGGGAYAIGLDMFSSEVLVEDSISVRTDKVIVARAAGAGSVVAYNYMDDGFIDYSENWIEIGLNASHFVGSHHVLFEGNYAFNADSDNTHGASTYMTFFRNWLRGVRHSFVNPSTGHTINDATQQGNGPARTGATQAYSYWFTYIGNVLGASGQMSGWVYQGDLTGGPAIWAPGWGESDSNGTWHTDPQVINTSFPGYLIRQGNWDWTTSSQKWDANTQPTAIPKSLYLTSAPDFFGTNQWPWVDPTTGKVYTLPAKARFDAGTPNG